MNSPVQTHSIDSQKIVFSITLENNKTAYMVCERKNYLNEERGIVVLDAKKFLTLWKAEPNPIAPELSKGTRSDWVNDRKYPDTELGFQQGQNNPVPLAKIVFNESTKEPYISVNDGITRIIWLLANGATAFPVECNVGEAEKLSFSAGLNQGEYLVVADLLKI